VSIFEASDGIAECDRLAADFVAEHLGGFQLSQVETIEGKVLASQLSR
jgi:hypothetical protein